MKREEKKFKTQNFHHSSAIVEQAKKTHDYKVGILTAITVNCLNYVTNNEELLEMKLTQTIISPCAVLLRKQEKSFNMRHCQKYMK